MTRPGGKVTVTSVPSRTTDLRIKVPPCSSTRPRTMGRPRPVPSSRRLLRQAAATEGGHHYRDLVLRNALSGILDGEELPPFRRPPRRDRDRSALRREFDGVGEQVERNLAHGSLVGPKARQFGAFALSDHDVLFARAQRHQVAAFVDDALHVDGFLTQLVASGLHPRQVEDLVDEHQQVLATRMDVAGVVLVGGNCMSAEQLGFHDFGEAENGVERRAQLVAHRGEEARLGQV